MLLHPNYCYNKFFQAFFRFKHLLIDFCLFIRTLQNIKLLYKFILNKDNPTLTIIIENCHNCLVAIMSYFFKIHILKSLLHSF